MAGASHGGLRPFIEKQGLAHDGLDRLGLERLGNQESRFRPLAGQQHFRIGGDENDRHAEIRQNFIHCVQARAAVLELDIAKHQPWSFDTNQSHRLGMGASGANRNMSEIDDEISRFIAVTGSSSTITTFDATMAPISLPAFSTRQSSSSSRDTENSRRRAAIEFFHRRQQKGLARHWRNRVQPAVVRRRLRGSAFALPVQWHGVPNSREKTIGFLARIGGAIEQSRVGDQSLKESDDIGVAKITNAVKHFKNEIQGKRRLHKKPNVSEIEHCRWWLEKETTLLAPKLTVALGARR